MYVNSDIFLISERAHMCIYTHMGILNQERDSDVWTNPLAADHLTIVSLSFKHPSSCPEKNETIWCQNCEAIKNNKT